MHRNNHFVSCRRDASSQTNLRAVSACVVIVAAPFMTSWSCYLRESAQRRRPISSKPHLLGGSSVLALYNTPDAPQTSAEERIWIRR